MRCPTPVTTSARFGWTRTAGWCRLESRGVRPVNGSIQAVEQTGRCQQTGARADTGQCRAGGMALAQPGDLDIEAASTTGARQQGEVGNAYNSRFRAVIEHVVGLDADAVRRDDRSWLSGNDIWPHARRCGHASGDECPIPAGPGEQVIHRVGSEGGDLGHGQNSDVDPRGCIRHGGNDRIVAILPLAGADCPA